MARLSKVWGQERVCACHGVVWDFGVDLLYGDDTDVAETQDPRIEIASLDLEARAHNTRKHAHTQGCWSDKLAACAHTGCGDKF